MSAELAMLLMLEGPRTGVRVLIDGPELTIGRNERCDLVIPDRRVSRFHARIRQEGDAFVLQDLGSKNRTFLNGEEVRGKPQSLEDGDEIQIALCCRLAFVAADATAPVVLEGLYMDVESKRVWVAGQEIDPPLSLAQYRLLNLLFQEPGRVYSRDDVVEQVWPDDERDGISEQAIDALARRLRERLAEKDPDRSYVVTVRGHGFRLENVSRQPPLDAI